MEESVEATLDTVAEIGYRNVEFAGYYDHGPVDIRRMLDERGLAAPACHVGEQALIDDAAAVIDAVATIGHEYLIISWLPEKDRNSPDSFRRTVERFNGWGRLCTQAGIRFAYHNHEFEFENIDGEVFFDVLLEETDPELVDIELDLFWIRVAGQSPFDYFERHPGRFKLFHVKDMDADGSMVDVGDGVMDFAAIAAADNSGVQYGFVEHDNPEDPAECIRKAYASVSSVFTG